MIESFFVRLCPGCKRRVSVDLVDLGKPVSCPRCSRQFVAHDPQLTSASLDDPIRYWIDFTDRGDTDWATEQGEFDASRTPR